MEQIANASQDQAKGVDQINSAVTQMDKVVQQNAANAEESASASEELSSQAQVLRQTVGQLAAMVGGDHRVNSHPTNHSGKATSNKFTQSHKTSDTPDTHTRSNAPLDNV